MLKLRLKARIQPIDIPNTPELKIDHARIKKAWISPEKKVYLVEHHGHDAHLPAIEAIAGKDMYEAMRDGWLRVGSEHVSYAESHQWTQQHLDTAKKFFQLNPDWVGRLIRISQVEPTTNGKHVWFELPPAQFFNLKRLNDIYREIVWASIKKAFKLAKKL